MTRETEKRKPDNPEQSRRFEEKARELGVDENGKKFEGIFGKIIKNRPPDRSDAPSTKKSRSNADPS